MNIQEVSHLVGLSKKSIRYYEENGLLKPKRNRENDYRVYDQEEIQKLKVIKFLRELNVPIHDLRLLQEKKLTLAECMRERIRKIEFEEKKFSQVKEMCLEICDSSDTFENIDITKYFQEMNTLNKEGFTMRNVHTKKSKKIREAVVSSLVFSSFFLFLVGILSYFQFTEVDKIPWIIYIFLILLFLFPVVGIVYNLVIRIHEIQGGEEDEASKY